MPISFRRSVSAAVSLALAGAGALPACADPAPSPAALASPAPFVSPIPFASPAASAPLPGAPASGPPGSQTNGITPATLAAAENDPSSWLVYGRDLAGRRFSPATQIDASNAGTLHAVWSAKLGPAVTMEGTPIVASGVMYATTGNDAVVALDAKTGATRWTYRYALPPDAKFESCCNTDNRGVTLTGDLVIFGTLDAHLIALDAKTGALRWKTTVAPYKDGYAITSPPLPVKNMVITGIGGGEYPTRGFIAAYDAASGKQRWRTYTIPGPGEAGYDTWNLRGNAPRGGGPTWLPGTYDPQSDTLYWGTGNPNPDFDAHGKSGALLYTSGLLAMHPDTGAIRWFHQFTPDDIWDFDGVNEPMLVDVPIAGKTVHAIAHADRNGYLYLLDRADGHVIYTRPFLDRISWGRVSPTTGVATIDPVLLKKARAGLAYTVQPSMLGGKNWEPDAYDPTSHLLFIPALESSATLIPDRKPAPHPKRGAYNFGGGFNDVKLAGSLSAWDLSTGTLLWKKRFRSPAFGGALATAGGVVYAGQMDGLLQGYDERTGRLVWQTKTPSGIVAPPISFVLDGRQYLSVEIGIGGVVPLFFMSATPWLKSVPQASLVTTYALPLARPAASGAVPHGQSR